MISLRELILKSPHRLALPISVYPGLHLTGAKVHDLVTNPQAQAQAIAALRRRYDQSFVVTAMDLSVEAETFGAAVKWADGEVPTVQGRLLTDAAGIAALAVPDVLAGRARVHLESARRLLALPDAVPVLGGIIGPFSLAGRLFGVSEMLELTMDDTEAAQALMEKTTACQIAYARAFRDAGVQGLVMAEPASGLLSPNGMRTFVTPYVQRILAAVEAPGFEIILHNCGARLAHREALLATGAKLFHFGAPMDLPEALKQFPADRVLCGNLDPAAVFVNADAATAREKARALLAAARNHRNFVLSSGCDLPPNTKLENLDAFYAALREENGEK